SLVIDPLGDSAGCARDLPFLKQLGVNAIRVYSVDSSLNHDDCMGNFSAAGIYTMQVIVLLWAAMSLLESAFPTTTTRCGTAMVSTQSGICRQHRPFPHNRPGRTTSARASRGPQRAPLPNRASTRATQESRTTRDASFLMPLANYLSCDPSGSNSASSTIDLFGLNNYEWCGDAPSTTYNGINGDFAGYNVAAYFSEFGSETCNPGVRVWTETSTLFSSPMTDIWSGGLAFSYFPAMSTAGQFGMVNISMDGTTVTPNPDFKNLASQYSQVTFVNSPSQSSAAASSFPACPTANSTWEASNTLPPTPNDAPCACLETALACQFHTSSSNYSALVGTLTNVACSLLGTSGGNCDDISGNGTTGVYGRVEMCDPLTKLSYVFSQYFELNGRQASACSFNGNGTVNADAPSGTPAAAASSCIANPSAVITPSFSAVAPANSASSSGTSSDTIRTVDGNLLRNMVVVAGCMLSGVLWTVLR
ncbi:Glucanosyltransferase-domain-containing protein, partial [Mycena pura]